MCVTTKLRRQISQDIARLRKVYFDDSKRQSYKLQFYCNVRYYFIADTCAADQSANQVQKITLLTIHPASVIKTPATEKGSAKSLPMSLICTATTTKRLPDHPIACPNAIDKLPGQPMAIKKKIVGLPTFYKQVFEHLAFLK